MNRIVQWIDVVLNELSKLNDNKGIEILNSCGSECSRSSLLLEGARKIQHKYESEKNIDKLFNAFKKEYYNSPNLTIQNNTVTLIFEDCTCPLVKQGISNSFLCNCTLGYSKKIFETLFNRKVDISLNKSVLNGDKICMQVIRVI